MHCAFFGKGDNTIVYLHGWGADGTIFAHVANRLPYYANVMPDFNGFGKSAMPPSSGWTVADYAEALHMFFVQYNIQHATIVAHSFGARVGIVFAATYANFCDKMLLFAPAALRKKSVVRACKVAWYKVNKSLRKLVGIPPLQSVGSGDYRNCPKELRPTFVKVVNQDLSRYARRVACPVLVVNGRDDTATPLSHAQNLTKLFPHGQLQIIDGDHFALFRNPDAFARIVDCFVRGC